MLRLGGIPGSKFVVAILAFVFFHSAHGQVLTTCTGSNYFKVVNQGQCSYLNDCIESANFGTGNYEDNDNCTIVMCQDAYYKVNATFEIEYNGENNNCPYDYLEINGVLYCYDEDTGGTIPSTVGYKEQGTRIVFKTDEAVEKKGFKLCFSDGSDVGYSVSPTVFSTDFPTSSYYYDDDPNDDAGNSPHFLLRQSVIMIMLIMVGVSTGGLTMNILLMSTPKRLLPSTGGASWAMIFQITQKLILQEFLQLPGNTWLCPQMVLLLLMFILQVPDLGIISTSRNMTLQQIGHSWVKQ